MLRIRERVTEPYVVRGAFHILANASPSPRVYWHPRFLERLRRTSRGRCMKRWDQRPVEIRNLFNPAFCGLVLFRSFCGYEEEDPEACPFLWRF